MLTSGIATARCCREFRLAVLQRRGYPNNGSVKSPNEPDKVKPLGGSASPCSALPNRKL